MFSLCNKGDDESVLVSYVFLNFYMYIAFVKCILQQSNLSVDHKTKNQSIYRPGQSQQVQTNPMNQSKHKANTKCNTKASEQLTI